MVKLQKYVNMRISQEFLLEKLGLPTDGIAIIGVDFDPKHRAVTIYLTSSINKEFLIVAETAIAPDYPAIINEDDVPNLKAQKRM